MGVHMRVKSSDVLRRVLDVMQACRESAEEAAKEGAASYVMLGDVGQRRRRHADASSRNPDLLPRRHW